MSPTVETSTPPNTPQPIGPYSHIAKVGQFITIGGTAGMNPATGHHLPLLRRAAGMAAPDRKSVV